MVKTKIRKEYFFTKNREIIDNIASDILISLNDILIDKVDKTIHYQIPYYNELEDALAGIKNEFTALVPVYVISSPNFETLAEMRREPEKNGNYTIVLFKGKREIRNIINNHII